MVFGYKVVSRIIMEMMGALSQFITFAPFSLDDVMLKKVVLIKSLRKSETIFKTIPGLNERNDFFININYRITVCLKHLAKTTLFNPIIITHYLCHNMKFESKQGQQLKPPSLFYHLFLIQIRSHTTISFTNDVIARSSSNFLYITRSIQQTASPFYVCLCLRFYLFKTTN